MKPWYCAKDENSGALFILWTKAELTEWPDTRLVARLEWVRSLTNRDGRDVTGRALRVALAERRLLLNEYTRRADERNRKQGGTR